MMNLTMQDGTAISLDRSLVVSISPAPLGQGTNIMINRDGNRGISVREPYAQVKRAYSMKGRRT